jgi:DNA-binding MarR family transcriptional regulator
MTSVHPVDDATTSDLTPLDDQLCFSLYAASLAVNRMYKPMLDAMGLTYPQYLVLSALGEEDGRTIGAIAGRLDLEPSTVTPLVKRLELAGFVARERSRADERQVNVALTAAGRAALAECKCLGDAIIARAGLSPAAFDALNRQVRALKEALSSSGE